MSGVVMVGFLITEMLAFSLALVKYDTLGNSAPSSKEMHMCVLVIHP